MAVASYIPLPAPLRITAALAIEWKRFKGQWMNYVKAAKIDKEEKDCRAAIFLACIGTDAYEVYANMEFAEESYKTDPDKLIEAFERHCIGEINEVYERYIFNRRQQEPGETFDTFVGDLRRLVRTCEYGPVEESTIRDRIVLGIRDDATRKKLLQMRKLNLKKAIDICRSSEATTRQLKDMTTPDEVHSMARSSASRSSSPNHGGSHGNRVSTPGPKRRLGGSRTSYDNRRPSSPPSSSSPDHRCRFCDRTHEKSKTACPAYNSTCSRCGKRNHWAAVCRQTGSRTNVCEVQDEESLMSLKGANDKRCFSNVFVNGRKIKFLLDCGSTVNLLPLKMLSTIGKCKTDLRPSRSVLRMFDRTELPTLGLLTAKLMHPRTRTVIDVEFYVTMRDDPILGIDACRRLDMLRIVEENICELTSAITPPPPSSSSRTGRVTEDDVIKQFADLFDGALGHLEGDVHLEVDPDVAPVQMPLRRLPVALRDRVEAELRQMVIDDVIVPVTTPTRWISALLVVAKQPKGIRICIDPTPLNRALQRSVYYMPTIDDILPKLSNAKIFSTVDAKSAFWQLKLDEQSSYLTTFETPFGRYRWRRMPYGISPAPEIFQARIHAALSGLTGVHCIADDILISGSGETVADAERDHDSNVIALLKRCREKGIKLNRAKLRLNRESTIYMGHELTSSGLRADKRKVEAILNIHTLGSNH